MDASTLIGPSVTGAGVVIAAAMAVYVNSPRRKRLVDEFGLIEKATPSTHRDTLTAIVALDFERYVRRRSRRFWQGPGAVVLTLLALSLIGAGLVFFGDEAANAIAGGRVLTVLAGLSSLAYGAFVGRPELRSALRRRTRSRSSGAPPDDPGDAPRSPQ